MPISRTIRRDTDVRLGLAFGDPNANLVYNQVFPGIDAGQEVGLWRKLNERTWFEDSVQELDKWGEPEASGYTDELLPFEIKPIGTSFLLHKAELAQYWLRGYTSAAEWVQESVDIKTFLARKKKEQKFWDFVANNNNYESAAYYANVITSWADTANAITLDDIYAGKAVLEDGGYRGNAAIINRRIFNLLKQNQDLNERTLVYGNRRDGGVNPTITAEFLMNVWDLEYLWIAEGSLLVDSSDPSNYSTDSIWGNSVLLFNHNVPAIRSPQMPSWLKLLFWRPDGRGEPSEGWFMNETTNPATGGVGTSKWDIWNYFYFLPYAKKLAYRIDNVY